MFHTHDYLQSDNIRHGFFGRNGGVSGGMYAGLNCGSGSYDNKGSITENRRRVATAMGVSPERLCTVHQVHSPKVVVVNAPFDGAPPEVDALVTDAPGLALGILTADCAPVLFADREAGIIAAAHAGWGGAFHGVVENTVRAMENIGANREAIHAVIGPCIAQSSYEVGPEFIARFPADDQAQFFIKSKKDGHFMFDLPAYVAARARRAGLQHVAVLAMDTYSDAEHFFSYRRATHLSEPDYGRQMSVIGLK